MSSLPLPARLTIAALAVLAPSALCGPARVVHSVRQAGHVLRVVCDARRPHAPGRHHRFPIAAEPPVLRQVTALLQRDPGPTLRDDDDAIQSDAPAPAMAAWGRGVPVLESLGTLAGFRPIARQHQRADRRSPRGPPVSLT